MMNIVSLLRQKRLKLAAAESFTGGGFSNYVTNIPKASQVFLGSIICYDARIKKDVLGIDSALIDEYGTVSKECARAMADNTLKLLDSDIAISFTGNAGPTGSEGKPVGLVYIGYATKTFTDVYELRLIGTRKSIKKQAIEHAVKLLLEKLGNQ